jgi:O-antigen/teichoic acid export membrane protein
MLGVFGSRIGVAMLGTLTGIILARGLGPHDRGLLALVLLLPSTLMTLTKFGITQANVYCVRREGASLDKVASNSLLLAIVLGAVCSGLAWLFRDFLLSTVLGGVPPWALALALWRLPLLLIDNYFWGVLQAMGNFSLYNRRTIAGASLILLLVAGVRFTSGIDLWSAVLIYASVTTLVVVSLLIATRRQIPFGLRPDTALLGHQVRFGLKSYTQVLTMHFLFRSDIYLVSYFLGPAETAFYSLALHFTEIILEIPQAVGWVVYPQMASLQKTDVHRLTAQACRRTILLTATGGVGAVTLGPIIIPMWYGGAFAAASKPLVFATFGAVMMSVFTILSRDFTSRNRQRVNIQAAAVALISNFAFNVYLIPAYGIVGAALATSLAYTLAAIMLLIPFRVEAGIGIRETLLPTPDDLRFIVKALADIGQSRWRRWSPKSGAGVATDASSHD